MAEPIEWYSQRTSGDQGLVIEMGTGRTVAVVYRAEDAPAIAEVPAMVQALRWAERELAGFQSMTGTPDAKLADLRAILARIEGEG